MKKKEPTQQQLLEAIRELLLSIRCLDEICECLEGRRGMDDENTVFACLLASAVTKKYKMLVPDYHSVAFCNDADALPKKLGVTLAKVEEIRGKKAKFYL